MQDGGGWLRTMQSRCLCGLTCFFKIFWAGVSAGELGILEAMWLVGRNDLIVSLPALLETDRGLSRAPAMSLLGVVMPRLSSACIMDCFASGSWEIVIPYGEFLARNVGGNVGCLSYYYEFVF